ncbi:hypothetical protein JS528_09235 [Bifidobacterium sp. MA2]|uniref:LigA n=1 Tax=Bifidobacterium santillanense TaxID=2809028 RepID=A0ABS5US71_9BIFI|nr:hypothetical protein [Bifidobacterium santillanense]MBT1173518.1 hypothetical protein [Bifidobacterium santillanense]
MGGAGLVLLVAALLIYTAGDLWQNIAWPPFFSFDETLEVDYVYQLTQGHLPTFFGGAEFNPLHMDYPYDVQWRYQHPPLFYALEAPVFLLFDTLHHPIRGIWAMRALVWVMGVLLIVCSRWAAKWVIGGECPAVSLVPVIVASNRCLPSVVFNYTLASLWVTLLIGMTAKLVRSMLEDDVLTGSLTTYASTVRMIVLWWLIVALAPLTRLSTVPIMGLCLLIVFLAVLLSSHRRIRNITVLCVLPGIIAVAASAWFYLRLHALSGNFTGSQPEWSRTHLQRNTNKTFIQALLDPHFYKSTMSQYQNSAVTNTGWGWAFVLLLTVIPMVVGFMGIIMWAVRRYRGDGGMPAANAFLGGRGAGRAALLMALMLALSFGGTVFQQLLFYKQGGSDNAVYFSLISIVFAVVIAMGFTWDGLPGWMSNGVVCMWLTLKVTALLYEAALKWPFAVGGTMEHAGLPAQFAAYSSLVVTCAGVLIAAVTVCLRPRPRLGAPNRPTAG